MTSGFDAGLEFGVAFHAAMGTDAYLTLLFQGTLLMMVPYHPHSTPILLCCWCGFIKT